MLRAKLNRSVPHLLLSDAGEAINQSLRYNLLTGKQEVSLP